MGLAHRAGTRAYRTLVVNSKGGCGKTTLTTNLAAVMAQAGVHTAILDHDPQGSSTQWLALRGDGPARVHGVAAAAGPQRGLTRSFQQRLAPEVTLALLDSPAGVDRPKLMELSRDVDAILIPVLPSPLDIHASTAFIEDVLRQPRVRSGAVRVGVVGNRVPRNPKAFLPLRHFLEEVGVELVATLRDDYRYLEAASRGLGVCELGGRGGHERGQWQRIREWLEGDGRDEQKEAPVAAYAVV